MTAPAVRPRGANGRQVRLGLRENWRQFTLLVTVNLFVGGMVGLERTVLPLVGTEEFGLTSELVTFSFIVAFGVVKAVGNLAAGVAADRHSRKAVLVAGWLVGLPVPFLLGYAPSWWWIVAANVLLGINQGLAWSMAVNMKIDLVGPRQRGLAMGLNEASGYTAVGLTALATGYIASTAGLRPQPFWLGIAYAAAGLTLSALVVRDTRPHAALEARQRSPDGEPPPRPSTGWVVAETSWRDRTLFGASQAGLVNNLNDGVSWGVLPVLFASAGVGVAQIGILKGVYPVIWGLGQVITGPLSDRVGRKPLVVWGMLVQAAGLATIGFGLSRPFLTGMVGSSLLGVGTAMVYPALLAAVGDAAQPAWRATSIGVYRWWRDIGYAVGALMAGFVAGALSLVWAVHVAGALTFAAGLVAWRTMREIAGGSGR
ncbi:MAG TPA: MFS transporter [Nitriliruptorales bacterium]|nr:MFS transporter [Nitriliruptorales bacterium]